jgi:hypothetical protein
MNGARRGPTTIARPSSVQAGQSGAQAKGQSSRGRAPASPNCQREGIHAAFSRYAALQNPCPARFVAKEPWCAPEVPAFNCRSSGSARSDV